MPTDLVIDLCKEENICGFKYAPDQGLWGPGIISNYQIYMSEVNKEWQLIDEGEFSNIKNNPLRQTKRFAAVKARYIELQALKNTNDNDRTGYAGNGYNHSLINLLSAAPTDSVPGSEYKINSFSKITAALVRNQLLQIILKDDLNVMDSSDKKFIFERNEFKWRWKTGNLCELWQ